MKRNNIIKNTFKVLTFEKDKRYLSKHPNEKDKVLRFVNKSLLVNLLLQMTYWLIFCIIIREKKTDC